MISHCICYQ